MKTYTAADYIARINSERPDDDKLNEKEKAAIVAAVETAQREGTWPKLCAQIFTRDNPASAGMDHDAVEDAVDDTHDPRDCIDRETTSEGMQSLEDIKREYVATMSRQLAWILEGRTYTERGLRASVCAYKIRPELVAGATLEDLAKPLGQGRSATHKLAMDYERTFGLRGAHAKSELARKHSATAWRKAHSPSAK